MADTGGSDQAAAARRFLKRKNGGLGGKKMGGSRTGNKKEIEAMKKRNKAGVANKAVARRKKIRK